jgi:hypothetical protein
MVQSNNAIFGRDRDFIRQVDWTTPALTPIGRQCNPGNVTLPGAFDFTTFTFGPGTNYGLPNLATPGFNACDATNDDSFVPSARRNSAIIGLHQEIGERVTIDVKAFYGQRTSSSYQPMAGQATVSPTNAFYEPAAANPAATQTVSFTFDPVLGRSSAPSSTAFYEWGANGEVSAKISDDWHLRTLLNYSTSSSAYHIVGLNQALLAAAGGAADPQAAVNFYNPAATPNLAVIRAIANSEISGQGQDSLFNARQIVEGGLFRLPGGQVRMAAGYEFLDDKFEQRVAPANAEIGAVNSVAFTPYDRTVNALFGEFLVPVVGEERPAVARRARGRGRREDLRAVRDARIARAILQHPQPRDGLVVAIHDTPQVREALRKAISRGTSPMSLTHTVAPPRRAASHTRGDDGPSSPRRRGAAHASTARAPISSAMCSSEPRLCRKRETPPDTSIGKRALGRCIDSSVTSTHERRAGRASSRPSPSLPIGSPADPDFTMSCICTSGMERRSSTRTVRPFLRTVLEGAGT